jgi:tRNA threonylcarbamoyladenosine biosynthesis protein TsaE
VKSSVYRTASEEETIQLGADLGAAWSSRGTVLLIGNLGAGKTTLAKGVVEGRGVAGRDDVTSPTFPLIHEYGDPVAVYHVDLYRLDTIAEVETLGLSEILERPALVLLEWAERFPAILPRDRIEVHLSVEDGEARRIEVSELP